MANAVNVLDDTLNGRPSAQLLHNTQKKAAAYPQPLDFIGGPSGIRTPDQLIKSQLLCQLS
jgi:hypothetical protein